MKTCTRCGRTLELSEFNFKNRATGRLQAHCRPCSRELIRDHYRRNVGYYVAKAHARKEQERRGSHVRVLEYLLAHPCIDCGEPDPVVLDFDHVDRASKAGDIASLIKDGHTWCRIEAEMAKCVVRCANCHRRRTAEQFGWYRGAKRQTEAP